MIDRPHSDAADATATPPTGPDRSIGCRPPGSPAAKDDAVTGKRVSGPLQGFGQLWQKSFTRPLDGVDMTPEAVIATWKAQFPTFWPKGQRFYAPLSGIAPGEVALLDIQPVPGPPSSSRPGSWSCTRTTSRSRS